MNALRRLLAHDLALYGLSTAVLQGTTIVLAPILARSLGPGGYGEFELLQVVVGLLSVVLVLGADTAVLTQAYEGDGPDHAGRVISTGFVVIVVAGAVGALLLGAPAGWIARQLTSPGNDGAVRAAAIALPALVVMNFARQTLRIDGRTRQYLAASAIGAVGQIAVVLALVPRDRSVAAAFTGIAVGAALSAVWSLGVARDRYRVRLDPAVAAGLLRFGLPVMLTGVAGWAVMFVDRVLLTRYVSLTEIGYYGIANKVALVLNLAIYSFGAWWPPHILRLHAEDPAAGRELRGTMLNRFLAGVAVLGLPAGALAPELVRVIAGDDFLPGARTIPILVVAFLCLCSLPVTQIAMLVTDRTRALVPPAVAAAVVNVGGCVLLCPRFGIAGAAWATAAAFATQAVGYYVLAQRLDRVDFHLRRTAVLAVLVGPVLALGWWTPTWWVGDVTKLPVVVVAAALLWRSQTAWWFQTERSASTT